MDWALVLTVPFITSFLALVASTVTDIRVREVPDWVSGGLLLVGILFSLAADFFTQTAPSWEFVVCVVLSLLIFAGYFVATFETVSRLNAAIAKLSSLVSFIMLALLVLAGLLLALWSNNFIPALSASLLGVTFGFSIGALLYYTGQWGGGDAKLLVGLGATLTLPLSWLASINSTNAIFSFSTWGGAPFFIKFLGLTIVCGAVYGLVWMLFLCTKNYSGFRRHFALRLERLKFARVSVWVVTGIIFLCAVWLRGPIGLLLLVLAAVIYASFYLMLAIKIAETQFMRKTIEARALTEGDWVVGGVKLGRTWIIPQDGIGATKEQIAILTKRAPRLKVVVKEGIPFVPSFLAAFLIAIF